MQSNSIDLLLWQTHIQVKIRAAHSSRHFRFTRMERKRLQSETIVDSGCVRAVAETSRIRMWTCSFYFIGRSRPHLSATNVIRPHTAALYGYRHCTASGKTRAPGDRWHLRASRVTLACSLSIMYNAAPNRHFSSRYVSSLAWKPSSSQLITVARLSRFFRSET